MINAIKTLANAVKKNNDPSVSEKDQIAHLLSVNPEYLQYFEDEYKKHVLDVEEPVSVFETNAKQASLKSRTGNKIQEAFDEKYLQEIMDRIVQELLDEEWIHPTGKPLVTNDDIRKIPVDVRPQLTGTLSKVDLGGPPSFYALLDMYKLYKNGQTKEQRQHGYFMFRQGLDILDLDSVLYDILGMNPNSMGYWFPALKKAVEKQKFFKVPETKIVKVPLPLLQISRLDYGSLTLSTLKIIDDWAMKAFDLDVNKTYFVKTGTFSSKYDFRNAKVTGEKEVRELGEYLVYIQHQAVCMAGPFSKPCFYGVSTTNEFVVREWIEDVENNPCIYKGMPLHTEYRVFVDFDLNTVLDIFPYWDPDVMKDRFLNYSDANSPHQKHDYIIYKAHEEKLMKRYNDNKDIVKDKIKALIQDINLSGQWSIDVMQNGNDFYIIDMALAQESAYVDRIPGNLLRKSEVKWIPDYSKNNNQNTKETNYEKKQHDQYK